MTPILDPAVFIPADEEVQRVIPNLSEMFNSLPKPKLFTMSTVGRKTESGRQWVEVGGKSIGMDISPSPRQKLP